MIAFRERLLFPIDNKVLELYISMGPMDIYVFGATQYTHG